jgi:hypothetical protein
MSYDKNGLGFMELTGLAFYHPFLFSFVFWMINHGLAKLGLKLTRMVI